MRGLAENDLFRALWCHLIDEVKYLEAIRLPLRLFRFKALGEVWTGRLAHSLLTVSPTFFATFFFDLFFLALVFAAGFFKDNLPTAF